MLEIKQRLEQVFDEKQAAVLAEILLYTLEDEAFKALPRLLQRDFGVIVKGRLKRQYVADNKGNSIEVNIIGEASRESEEVVIIGEAKSQLSKNDVDDFLRRKLKRFEGVFEQVFPVLVTYMTTAPDVEDYVRQKRMALYYSYDF